MAAGQLWLARIPATSEPWQAELGNPSTLIPPLDALVDVLPANIAFGLGMAMVVAPLTSTLMNSIPARNSGLGSAINNALSRVGQPLIGAVIFIAITAAFYNILGSMVPGLDTDRPGRPGRDRAAQPPTARARPTRSRRRRKEASVDAFHLAALAAIILLIGGAAANQFGLRGAGAVAGVQAEQEAPADPAAEPAAGAG